MGKRMVSGSRAAEYRGAVPLLRTRGPNNVTAPQWESTGPLRILTFMKVLHLRSGGGLYGAEKVVLSLAQGSSEAGHEVAVMNLQRPGQGAGLVEAVRALGLEARAVACTSQLDLGAVREIRRRLDGRGVDLIHSHDYKSDFYALLCARGIPHVATCHNWASDKLRMRFYRALNKRLMRGFSRIAAVSEPLRRELLLSGIDGSKLVMIPNGVPLEEGPPAGRGTAMRRSLGLGEEAEIVIAVGRLAPEKGHLNLIAAAQAVAAARPRSKFLVVGEGPLRLELEEAARVRGLCARFMFLGVRQDVRELLAASDVFVLPSFKEGLPLAMLEAMACRRPVIAAPVGEVPAVVADGVSGLLVDPADAAALSGSIIRLLGSPAEAAALAEAGYRRVLEEYSAAAMVRRYHELYREALAE